MSKNRKITNLILCSVITSMVVQTLPVYASERSYENISNEGSSTNLFEEDNSSLGKNLVLNKTVEVSGRERSDGISTGIIDATEIVFDEQEISITPRDKRYLEYKVLPSNVTEEEVEVIWKSSDPAVVSVNDEGMIECHKEGDAVISVQKSGDEKVNGSITIHVTAPVYDVDYDVMKDRWLNRIIGTDIDMSDPDIASYVKKIDEEGKKLWSELHKEENRTTLWDKISSDTTSADYTTQFTKLQKLTLAFGVEGSSLYQNKTLYKDIIGAIDFMVTVKKYDGKYRTGNWWDWEIGTTHQVSDILMIMSDYTNDEIIKKAVQSIEGYVPKPARDGANLTDLSIAVLGSAIVGHNDERMNMVKQHVPETMTWVESGNGIYKDGSVIQHGRHAYNGSYGNELIKGIGKIQNVISGTKFAIIDDRIQNVYDVIVEGYLPLMHRGQMMSMVNGRSISRAPGTNNPFTTEFATGAETISNILLLTESAPIDKKDKIESALKSWIGGSDGYYDFYSNARDFSSLLGAKDIMEDEGIEAVSYEGMKVYGSMDRIVQANKNYTAGLSMYSSRVYNYESINNENLKGWHTGDGVLYVYNNDLEQYGEGYWPTVDPYRLPGTTVDTRELKNAVAEGKLSPQSWVGGATDGNNGSAAMLYNSTNLGLGMDLKARKSWFFLDGKIVALGSDISGNTDASIETTLENRMMTDESNKISVNGKEFDKDSDSLKLDNRSYVHFTGTGEGNDLGYYFIQGDNVDISKENRTGEYKDINTMFPNGIEYNKKYFKMGINHGQNVKDGSYEYVILPGIKSGDLKEFADNNTIEVIRNDADVQAISDVENGIFAMNVWAESTPITVNGITVNDSASVFATENDGLLTISISDPKQKNVKLNLKLETGYNYVVDKSDSVTVNEDGTFTIDTKGSAGASHSIVVSREIFVGKVKNLKGVSEKTNVDLTWDEPKEVVGLVEYIIYKDGKVLDTIAADKTSYNAENLKSNTIYGFKVVAKYSNDETSKPVSVNIRTKK